MPVRHLVSEFEEAIHADRIHFDRIKSGGVDCMVRLNGGHGDQANRLRSGRHQPRSRAFGVLGDSVRQLWQKGHFKLVADVETVLVVTLSLAHRGHFMMDLLVEGSISCKGLTTMTARSGGSRHASSGSHHHFAGSCPNDPNGSHPSGQDADEEQG